MARSRQRSTDRAPEAGPTLPVALRAALVPLLGPDVDALEHALTRPAPVSIRTNPFKGFVPTARRVPWCSNGHYLEQRPAFTFDPLLHAGAYYVQEASSMLLEPFLRAGGLLHRDLLALDLCAAPGGKSTQLRSLITPGSLLVSNEVDRKRALVLQENCWKWGVPNTMIARSSVEDFRHLPAYFDLIVLDAPCSGAGMFRKDPFARQQWSEALVQQCATTQRSIVEAAWTALAPGGVLIYSTCTWDPAENEAQLLPLVTAGAEQMDPKLDPAWGVQRTEHLGVIAHRCYPHRVEGEGFCMAMLRKPGERSARTPSPSWNDRVPSPIGITSGTEQFVTTLDDERYTVDAAWRLVCGELQHRLHLLSPGTPVQGMKGGKPYPHAALATSSLLDRSVFPALSLGEEQAIAYLRGGVLPAQGAQGPALVTYRDLGLGWVHGAGNRWNNRWPDAWRIRAQQPLAPRVSWSEHSTAS